MNVSHLEEALARQPATGHVALVHPGLAGGLQLRVGPVVVAEFPTIYSAAAWEAHLARRAAGISDGVERNS